MTDMHKDEVQTYIEFDSKTGSILTITSYPTKQHIEVDPKAVVGLLDGSENFLHYKVQFNPTSTMYELVNVHEEERFEYNVHNSIYKIPTDIEADINIIKNYKTKTWQLQFGKLFSKTLEKNSVTLQTIKNFSVVDKNDPYKLHRTLRFNLADVNLDLQFNQDDAIITQYDLYTNKLFNSYSTGVIND